MDDKSTDAALLDWLGKNPQCELSHDGWDTELWQVHEVIGGRNDREWKLIGQGETVRDAIRSAQRREMDDKSTGEAWPSSEDARHREVIARWEAIAPTREAIVALFKVFDRNHCGEAICSHPDTDACVCRREFQAQERANG